jgi:hypothetical protein
MDTIIKIIIIKKPFGKPEGFFIFKGIKTGGAK